MSDDGRLRVLVAPDAFRGSISAVAAADAIARGIESRLPTADVRRLPIADGGEGTLQCALASGFRAHPVTVRGPLGDPVNSSIAGHDRSALVELAELCGWARLPDGRTAPLDADTRGLGDGIRAALDLGCRDLVIAVGGSVSTDGGLGMLHALGAVLRDADGEELTEFGGRHLHRVRTIDTTGLDPRLADVRIRLATDVANPLVGDRGAAAVFGPQKGADTDDVRLLDDGLTVLADVVAGATGTRTHDLPGAGAAGGIGATAVPYLGAEIVSGADVVLDLVGFDAAAAGAHWVVTGEGKWDSQSADGKAPARVAARARSAGALVALVAGVVDASADDPAAGGFSASCALLDLEPDLERCLHDPEPLLVAAGDAVATHMTTEEHYA